MRIAHHPTTEGLAEFEVEDILDSRLFRRQRQYLVKWKGYPTHEATWEPAAHLEHSPTVLEAYNARISRTYPRTSPRGTSLGRGRV